jgi:NADH:ubiquinone oxidoreductase subunit 5 (subunit L)/multisubunit Na+/H+ antiporter MnhA subunit
MSHVAIVALIVFVPVAGAFLLPLAGMVSLRLRNILALLMVTTSFVLSLTLVPFLLKGGTITYRYAVPLGLNFVLQADQLAVFMAMVSSFIGAIIVLYSFGYISHYRNQSEYYLMVVLFIGSMMGLVFSGNLILLFVFWEVTAITSWRLIGFYRERPMVVRADKSFLVTVFGALVMLLGFIMLYAQTGTFDLVGIKQSMAGRPVADVAVLLILFGILSKSATLPMQTWLPDAGVAPSPVTALLHAAVLVKIGVYVYARLFVATLTLTSFWTTAVPVIAGASALVSAGAALVDTDLKRIIAYSTISQIGFIFLGLATNTAIGVAGGLLYILMHGLAKAGLFLCAGIVEQNTHCKDITKLGGLFKTMPITAISFLLCSFSVMGIPPFGGFFSKYMVIAGTVHSGQLGLAAVFMVGAVLTILYLFRVFTMVFMGETKCEPAREGSPVMVFCVALLAALSLVAGPYVHYPGALVGSIVQQMVGLVK